VVCAGDFLPILDKPELVVYLNAFYPDYVLTPGVGPSTASANLNNPAWLYSVYYQGSLLGMNALMAGEELTIDEYTVTFTDPQNFTLIQIKRDRFTWLALLGGLTCWVYIHRRVIRSLLLGTRMPKCPHFLPRAIRRKLGA
jgi:hypothetical protein